MLTNDGTYVIYRLQAQQDGDWYWPNYDHFGTPKVTGPKKLWTYNRRRLLGGTFTLSKPTIGTDTANGFGASGDCWQKTGVHGTFDQDAAFEAQRFMEDKFPLISWRVVQVNIMQMTTAIINPPKKRKKKA